MVDLCFRGEVSLVMFLPIFLCIFSFKKKPVGGGEEGKERHVSGVENLF